MAKYKVLRIIENDKTEKMFEPGATITEKDFPKRVLDHWEKKGIVKKIESPKAKTKAEGKEE